MEEWKEYKLGEIIDFTSGGTPNKNTPKFWNGDIPWISAKTMYVDFVSTSDLFITQEGLEAGSKLAPKGTILLLTRGSGLFNTIPICKVVSPVAFNQDVKCLYSRNEGIISNDFLFYWLKGNEQTITNILETTGIGAGKIDTKRFLDLPIKLPSLKEQEKLVEIASSLFEKIKINNAINENLEQQAQALFKSWFVDFEPFRDQPFVESELGMIPEGWRVRRLEEFCDVFTGKKNVYKSIARGKYPFFSCSPINTYSNEYIYDGESIIIAGNGSYTGRTSFYIGKYDLYQRTYACVLRPGVSKELSAFLYFMMKNLFEPFKMGGTRGSSIPYIVMKDITLQSFPYFEDIANKFSNISYFILRHILANQAESHRLSLLRDTLLPKMMSGEIKL